MGEVAACLWPGWPACKEQQWKSHSVEVGEPRLWFASGCWLLGRGWESLEIKPPAHSMVCVWTAGALSMELPWRDSCRRGDGTVAAPPINCRGGIILPPGGGAGWTEPPLLCVSWPLLPPATWASLSAVITVTWGAVAPDFLCISAAVLAWTNLSVELVGRMSLASLLASRLWRGP